MIGFLESRSPWNIIFFLAKKIPLNPPFVKGGICPQGGFLLFEKACPEPSRREGQGEILDKSDEKQ